METYAEIEEAMRGYGCRVRVGAWLVGGINARIGRGRLEVTQGFMSAPEPLQRVILAHEAGHVREHHGWVCWGAAAVIGGLGAGVVVACPAWLQPLAACGGMAGAVAALSAVMRWQEIRADSWAARRCDGYAERQAALPRGSLERGWVERLISTHPPAGARGLRARRQSRTHRGW